MTALGFNQPLYILPFDHRGSFQTKMFGWKGMLSPSQPAEIAATKQVIYDGLKAALKAGVPERKAGILVDEGRGRPKGMRVAHNCGHGRWPHRICCGTHQLLGPLVDLRAQKITREAAVTDVARRYREYVNIFGKRTHRSYRDGELERTLATCKATASNLLPRSLRLTLRVWASRGPKPSDRELIGFMSMCWTDISSPTWPSERRLCSRSAESRACRWRRT
jgi:hypothetical protein